MAQLQRKSASSPPGVVWRQRDGKVSSTASGKAIWLAGLEAMGKINGYSDSAARIAAAIETERDWRHNYVTHLSELSALAASGTEAALAQAEASLAAFHDTMSFCRDGKSESILEATADDSLRRSLLAGSTVETIEIIGQGSSNHEISVPIDTSAGADIKTLSGEKLVAQLQAWVDYGAAEPSTVASISSVVSGGESSIKRKLSSRTFVLLGATSALGPARPLLSLGATVAAIARPGRKLEELMSFAESSPGKLLVPSIKTSTPEAGIMNTIGIDLLTQLPEAAEWLLNFPPEETLVIGSYIYLDGEKHVRAVAAMDALLNVLLSSSSDSERTIELAYLGSPSTPHLWVPEAEAAAQLAWSSRSWLVRSAGFKCSLDECGVSSALIKTADMEEKSPRRVYNGCMVLQGPNYALAKTAQVWRAILARRGEPSRLISFNYAPPGRTESMLHNPTMATVLNGMQNFSPLLVLESYTASSIMALLLLSDLKESSAADTATGVDDVATDSHPWEFLNHNSFHGGCDRCPFSISSIGNATWLLGNLKPIRGTIGLLSE